MNKLLTSILMMVGGALVFVHAHAQTYQPPAAFVSGTTGQNGQSQFRYTSGTNITATFSTTATVADGIYSYGVRTASSTLGAIGVPSNTHFTYATTTTPGVLLGSWGWGCPQPGILDPINGSICTGRGTMTVTFSEPVTNPVIHVSAPGTHDQSGTRHNIIYTLASAQNGGSPVSASLTALSGNSSFAVSGSSIINTRDIATVDFSCGTGAASCGSVQVNGTVTSVTFQVSERGYGLAGYTQTQDATYSDGHVLSASIAPLVDLAVTKTNTPSQGSNDLPDDTYEPGETRTYTMVVTNNGPNTVSGATVTDIFPILFTGASWTATYTGTGASGPASGSGDLNASITLPPGGTATFTVAGTVSASATGSLTNTVTVTAPAGATDTDTSNNTATDSDTLAQADVQVVKAVSPNTAVASGTVVTYTLTMTNSGPNDAIDVLLSDAPSAGLNCITPSPTAMCSASGGASCPSATVPVGDLTGAGITIPTLPVGGQVVVTMQCTVAATGTP